MNKDSILALAEKIKNNEPIRLPEELRESAQIIAQHIRDYEQVALEDMQRGMDFFTFLLNTLIKPSHEAVKSVIEEGLKRKFSKEEIHTKLTMRLAKDRRGKKFIPKLEEM